MIASLAAFLTFALAGESLPAATPVDIVLGNLDRELSALQKAADLAAPKNPKTPEGLKARLRALIDLDQRVRKSFMQPPPPGSTPEETRKYGLAMAERMGRVDHESTTELKAMIKRFGWPDIPRFGVEADHEAWLLVQHADRDPGFQREILKRLKALNLKNATASANVAYLEDRILAIAEGKPQLYGTQGKCVGPGKWEPHPILEPAKLTERRKSAGLGDFQTYVAGFKDLCF